MRGDMKDQLDEITRIRILLKENPKGMTIEDIAKKLPLNRTSTAKYLNTLLISGQAEMRTFGRAKVFTLSQRVPFSQMLNLSSDLLLVLDHELFINQVNEPFLRFFDLTKEELVGVRIDNAHVDPFLSAENIRLIRESVKGTESTRMERIEINGQEFFFKIKMIPVVFDHGGQGLTVILEDITEVKKYQQHLEQLVDERTKELITTNEQLLQEIDKRQKSQVALEQSERKYRELVQTANSIILRINNEGVITFFNEFAENFFGLPGQEVLGKNIVGTIISSPDNQHKDPAGLIYELLKPTEHMIFNEAEVIRRNKEKAWVAWTSKAVLDARGNFSEFLLVGMDISERKQVENALHQINTKLNLVSSIARHDILNKLTSIYGIISLLKETIVDPTYLEYLKKAEESALAIKRQIEFTRDYKDMGVEKADWQVVSDTVSQALATRNLKGIVLDIPRNGLEIFADPWLKKVFFNLIDNVVRYGEHATKITISYHESIDGLDILFKDNGVGIPLNEKKRIFERGYGKNTGYGLFMAREILAITGLTIRETGELGEGARFEIRVPKQAYRFKKEGNLQN